MSRDGAVKCLVWDLDNTVWNGVLLEDREVTLRPGVRGALAALDERGILHSVASKNDPETALRTLDALGLGEYFLYPQIGWQSKVASITAVAKRLNIGIDAIGFIDDDPCERDEVRLALPAVWCVDAAALDALLTMPELSPRIVTPDARVRRLMYQSDARRQAAEAAFVGPSEAFLSTLGMSLTITAATEGDLQRAEELTIRTHQLNTTGHIYSYDELDAFRRSAHHHLLLARLDDKYGSYGHIGLALVETAGERWIIRLLLMSCRVMSKGIGSVMIGHLMRRARAAGARLCAEFVPTGKNRMMYLTYRFHGFRECEPDGTRASDGAVWLEYDLTAIPTQPNYISVTATD
jgi:FkbH-like protein